MDLRVSLRLNIHGGVLESGYGVGELPDEFRGHFAFASNAGGEFTRVILYILRRISFCQMNTRIIYLNMGLNLNPQFLKVLNDARIDGAAEVRMLVGDDACLVSDVVVDIL